MGHKMGHVSGRSKNERQRNFFSTCSHCATGYSCCRDTTPPVTGTRRKIIETYLSENEIYVKSPFAETDYVFPKVEADGYCVFHDTETRECRIHSVKPETCVAGPITFDINKRTGEIEWYIKMEQICPLAGVVYQDKKLLDEHLDGAKKEILRLVKQLDPKALRSILTREESQTLKMCADRVERSILDKLEGHG